MAKVVVIALHEQEREILCTVLRQHGHSVFMAPPSAGNYIQFLQFRPHIVLVEMTPRPVDQIAALRLLKKNKTLSRIPVLCYGPAVDAQTLKSYRTVGAADFLARPLRVASLFERMKALSPEVKETAKNATAQGCDAEQKRAEEYAQLEDPTLPPNAKLDIMVRYIGKLMAFPFTVTRTLQVSSDEGAGANDLAKVIASDSAICSTILKVSNSVHFGSQKEIRNPRDAVIRIGFSEAKNIVLGLGVLQLMGSGESSNGYSRQAFWYRSLGRGIASERLALHIGWREGTVAFLAGLLSEFGLLLMDEFFPGIFAKICEQVLREGCTASAACLAILGVDHRQLCIRLLEDWRLPKDLTTALKQETSALTTEPGNSTTRPLDLAIALSGPLCAMTSIGRGLDAWVEPIPDERLREMRLPAGIGPAFHDTISGGVRIFANFLGLDASEGPSIELSPDRPKAVLLRFGRKLCSPHLTYLDRLLQLEAMDADSAKATLAESDPPGLVLIDVTDAALLDQAHTFVAEVSNLRPDVPILGFVPAETSEPNEEQTGQHWLANALDLRRLDQDLEALMGESVQREGASSN